MSQRSFHLTQTCIDESRRTCFRDLLAPPSFTLNTTDSPPTAPWRHARHPYSTFSAIKMSLFGGSAPPSETERSQPASEASSPSIDGRVSPPSAQPPNDLQNAIESGEDDDILSGSESESEESDEQLPTRPNRFKGRSDAWKGHTAADRQIATSLEQIQNKDLGAHLYNAHALKRRVRRLVEDLAGLKSWQNRDLWLKKGKELEFTDVSGMTQTELVPVKDWTAWPLPPARSPMVHGQSGRFVESESSEWRIRGMGIQDVGDEMREEMLATFLRLAKERWSTRQPEDVPQHKQERNTQSRSRSRSKSIRSARSASKADVHMKDDSDSETNGADTGDEEDHKFAHILGRKTGRPPQPETLLTPTIMADDQKALTILQPSISSILSELDDLALAVRRTRFNHFGGAADSDMSSHSEFTSGVDSSEAESRASSRAASRPTRSRKLSTRPSSRATSAQYRPATMKARIMAQNNPASDSDTSSDESVDFDTRKDAPPSRRSSTAKSFPSERGSSIGRGDGRAGLMDWSEVLGLAAAQGWNERAVSRAAQRCAALFGESMSLIPLEESLATKPTGWPIQYTPSTIPAPDMLFRKRATPAKRPYFRIGTLRCPHADCPRHEKDYESPHRVVQHCIREHGYDPRTNNADNEERTVGGVHIDGFLQTISRQRGWTEQGQSRAASARRQPEKEEEAEEEAEGHNAAHAMMIDSD